MVSQHGLRLAAGLITSHFGDLVGKVCECLLRRGTLSLHEIIRFTELSSSQVKNCLLVLIQHSCVQAFSIPRPVASGAEIRTLTQYMALFDNILHRLRFSKFLSIVQADLGLQCRNLLEGLLQHGRLTFEQLAEREASTKGLEGSTSSQNILRAEFDRLVRAHYVERCPRPEPFISPPEEDKLTSTKRRGSKADAVNLSVEELAMIGAALPVIERFSAIGSTGEEEESKTPGHNSYTVGDKRKHEALIDKETQAVIVESGVLWRVNFEKFVYCLKKKACATNVRSRYGLDAGIVLEAMIESNTSEGNKNSVQSSIENIIEAVRGKPGGIGMTMEHVRVVLEKLGSSISSKESGVLYEIDLKVIIKICQTEEVEALVLKKYGEVAHRIFRFLVKQGVVQETDHISDVTLIEKKTTQGILLKLWKDEFLEMKKAIAQGSGTTQHFLWRVNWDELCVHILDDMYHAALNLSQKIAHILEQEQEALQDKAKRQRLQKGRLILESSLLKLDDALMLFHDF
ncbi:DNA-directed RNA polymerase III subunit rpc3 [Dioscorea cayenensis subsp. rotundata]|uniref:DNA-directed RNA polymerase III subunit RPC3 n=1 Tax=Dioscorea cayennensis subsp. rotundata TaxID=55577 RepID=A0AB40AQU7_DIOCR|nr:DNA-directed RNA polymerase III subunit rpc3 [Dioscorea cayenensis subsp. rotundata]